MSVTCAGGRPKTVPSLRELPAAERPRERLLAGGPEPLTDAELLGLLIGSGRRGATAVDLARRLLVRHGELRRLGRLRASELARERGIGPARAARLAATFELCRRYGARAIPPGTVIRGPDDVVRWYRPRLADLHRERFYLLLLDSRCRLIRDELVAEGTVDEAVVHPREAFAAAIRESAVSVLAVHNHPSGDPEPSLADVQLTRRLAACGELLGIPLEDHVVVARRGYVSFHARGLIGGPAPPEAAQAP